MVVVLGSIGSVFATTSVNVVLTTVGDQLGAGVETVQWIASGYMLGMASTISITGWLSRRVGARRLYLGTLVLFAAASCLCAVAPTIELLILFRVIQGVVGGATMPVGMMMLATAAGPQRMGRVMSVVGVPMVLGPITGPVLGGFLVDALSWHWIFLMNIPLAVVAVVLGVRLLPEVPMRPSGPFDGRGFVLMVAGPPLVIFGLTRCGTRGSVLDPVGLTAIVAGLLLVVGFGVHALRREHPLLDVRLWANRGFAASSLTAMLISAALFGSMVLLPLSFEALRGVSPAGAGLLLMPQGVGAAVGTVIAGRLADRLGGGRVAVLGVLVVAAATVPLLFVDGGTPSWVIVAVLFLRGVGMGGAFIPATSAAYAHVRRDDIPDATPQLNVVQRIGGATGAAVLTLALASMLPAVGGTSDATAAAYHYAFAWVLGFVVLALVPASILVAIERAKRRARASCPAPNVV